MKAKLITLMLALSVTLAMAQQKGYAPVNGLKLYYEVHGTGKPIVLLHGSFMTIEMNWKEMLPLLSKTRKVIVVEMQGHGRTADIDRPISYKGLADDVAGLLKYLKIDSADIVGYSLGGSIAYQLAISYPKLVTKLVVISGVHKTTGWTPAVSNAIKSLKPEFFENTPIKSEYVKVAPDPGHFTAFINKVIAVAQHDFDLGDENIKNIKAPVLLVSGDSDGMDYNQLIATFKLLGGGVMGDMQGLAKSQLAILPGATHVTLMMQTDKLLSFIQPFIDNKPQGPSF